MYMSNNANDKSPLNTVYLGIGTNLGDKKKNIEVAFDNIEEQIGDIVSISALFISKSFGYKSDNLFVNCAVIVTTTLSPRKLLEKAQMIEKEMGRIDKTDSIGNCCRLYSS